MTDGLSARNVIDFAVLTVNNVSAVSLANANPTLTAGHTVHRAFFSVETDDIRYRADGVAPTATVGHLVDISIDPTLKFMDANYESVLQAIQFNAVTNNASMSITYYD